MSKVIVHIDLNAFFVRCEEIKDPSLVGKAVAIGHEGRGGIVSTCSYEARKYGVSSAMPMFIAKQKCPHLIIKPSDFRFYHAKSHEFFKFVKRYTKIIEIASVDECFADFTEVVKNEKDVYGFFLKLQNDLFEATSLKCSMGIAPTKFLAKMGSDYKKPMGITIIRRKDISQILYPLSIDKMFGVGKKSAPRLKQLGINTIGDLADKINQDDEGVKNVTGKFFYTLKEWLNGYGDDKVIIEPFDPKSIGNSQTLANDTSNFEEIKPYLVNLCKEVSERAIKANKKGTTIQIVVKDTNFKSFNKSLSFETPTNSYKDIYVISEKLYLSNFSNLNVRLVGVTLQNLIDPRDVAIQMSLFNYQQFEEEDKTKLLINDLNRKLEKPSLIRASEVKKNGNK